MIFKRLFQKAHAHPDPAKREEAVGKLNVSDERDKQILHELAFNDDAASVSIRALHALDSFTLWLKAFEAHLNPKVQQRAKTQVLALIEQPQSVDDVLFTDIVKQGKHSALLKEMLFNSARLQHHAQLAVNLALKLCAENELRQYYIQIANDEQRRSIINAFCDDKSGAARDTSNHATSNHATSNHATSNHTISADIKAIKRFKKLENSPDLAVYIEEKLYELEQRAAMPSKVKATATLLNSRLLALSDMVDYESIEGQKQALFNEFDALKPDFIYLSEAEAGEISAKYLKLKEKVEKRQASLEPAYMAQKHLNATADAISDVELRAKTIFQQINILNNTDESTQLDSQVELLSRAVEDLRLELNDIERSIEQNPGQSQSGVASNKASLSALVRKFDSAERDLNALPERIARNGELERLLSQIKQTDEGHEFERLSVQIEALVRLGCSARHKASWDAIKQEHAKAQANEKAQLISAEKRCFAKLKACSNMIEQGKFKAAMATYSAAAALYDELNTEASASLTHRFEQVQQKVSELKDWQSYIATPRKPEIISAVSELANNSDIDIDQRAALVKQYRGEYSSLGKLNTPDDDKLNTAFEEAIERAFAPCREYFAELDKAREQNLSKGKQILEALDAIATLDDAQILSKQLASIGGQYRKLGNMQQKARSQLHKQYLAKLRPLQAKVDAFYQANAAAKQKLLDAALALSSHENVDEAASQAKALQTKWKNIAYAGRQQDQALWQQFRQANDAVFARLSQSINAQKQVDNEQANDIELSIKGVNEQIAKAESFSDLKGLESKVDELKASVASLPTDKKSRIAAKCKSMESALADKNKRFEQDKSAQRLNAIFSVLESGYMQASQTASQEDVSTSLASMSAQFRQAFDYASQFVNEDESNNADKSTEQGDIFADFTRADITHAADILLHDGKITPDSADKKRVQLSLMAAKLEGQSLRDADGLLIEWISKGRLQANDFAQLNILKSLFGLSDPTES
ncbi:DUF349 domain-containing protein [Glaciecola siphonariae]|uniref:DUF349 domain-containing protein n=1 Tax=Glaciecola siphonariae TaxID=521012 RepID=A0ABV9LSZ1_9ALTE